MMTLLKFQVRAHRVLVGFRSGAGRARCTPWGGNASGRPVGTAILTREEGAARAGENRCDSRLHRTSPRRPGEVCRAAVPEPGFTTTRPPWDGRYARVFMAGTVNVLTVQRSAVRCLRM